MRFAPVNVSPPSFDTMTGVACEYPVWLMFSKKKSYENRPTPPRSTVLGVSRNAADPRGSNLVLDSFDRAIRIQQAALDLELGRWHLRDRIVRVVGLGRASIGLALVVSKPARLRSAASLMPPRSSNRTPRFSVSRSFTRQSSCRKMPCDVWRNSPVDAISNWLDAVPGVATAPFELVGRPSRNCAHDCARSFVPLRCWAGEGAVEPVAAGRITGALDHSSSDTAGRSPGAPNGRSSSS